MELLVGLVLLVVFIAIFVSFDAILNDVVVGRLDGELTYYQEPNGRIVDAKGQPRRFPPDRCPLCNRRLRYAEWGSMDVYPIWRCDGFWGTVPLLGSAIRAKSFHQGRHYTFQLPPRTHGIERAPIPTGYWSNPYNSPDITLHGPNRMTPA